MAERVKFDEAVTLLDQAERNAPAAISDDIAAYVAAYVDVGYDLDVIFSTPEGMRRATDTNRHSYAAVAQGSARQSASTVDSPPTRTPTRPTDRPQTSFPHRRLVEVTNVRQTVATRG